MKQSVEKQRLFSPLLITFMSGMILANIASRMDMPLIPLYVQSLGASVEQVGLFFTVTSIVPLVFQIVGGFISDSIGRVQAVAIGSVAGVMGYILYILAPSWDWLILAGSVSSLSYCFVAPSFQAFIAEQSTEENRGRVFALTDSVFMIVGVIGPPIGGYVSEKYGFRAMFIVAGSLYAVATVIRMSMARNVKRSGQVNGNKPTWKGFCSHLTAMAGLVTAGGVVTWLFLSDGVIDVAVSMSSQLQPLYQSNLFGLGPAQISSLLSIYHVATMILLPVGGWFADKAGERAGIVLGHSLFILGNLVFVLGSGYVHFAAVQVLFGMGDSVLRPSYNSLISKVVPLHMRGTAFGLVSTSLGLISLPAPYIGGLMWHHICPRAPFFAPLIANLIITPLLWFKLKGSGTRAPLCP